MRKLFILAFILFLSGKVYAANEQMNPYKIMAKSNNDIHYLYTRLAENFRRDNQFSSYLRNRRTLFESDRQRLIGILFPYPNNKIEGYTAKYPEYISEYSVTVNKREAEILKDTVETYCKNNKLKLRKKAPQACLPETIQQIFKIMQ